jgi:hypothetical protein
LTVWVGHVLPVACSVTVFLCKFCHFIILLLSFFSVGGICSNQWQHNQTMLFTGGDLVFMGETFCHRNSPPTDRSVQRIIKWCRIWKWSHIHDNDRNGMPNKSKDECEHSKNEGNYFEKPTSQNPRCICYVSGDHRTSTNEFTMTNWDTTNCSHWVPRCVKTFRDWSFTSSTVKKNEFLESTVTGYKILAHNFVAPTQ